MKLRFFVGGAEGDAFGTIVYNGARQAAADTGADVDYVFSGWSMEKMVQQLREAVAAKPAGIAMMGHPGDAPIMPLAEQASKDGIKMMYQNVPVPEVVAAFGGGYVGAQLEPQGAALGERAFKDADLAPGDTVIVLGPFNQGNRAIREIATVEALEEAGANVVQIDSPPEWAADPNLAIPVITAAILNNPDVKAIGYPGGQTARQRADLHAGGGQAAGRDLQLRLRHQPADRRGLQGRLGAADLGPAAVPAGLPADPQPVPAGRLRAVADGRRYRRRASSRPRTTRSSRSSRRKRSADRRCRRPDAAGGTSEGGRP